MTAPDHQATIDAHATGPDGKCLACGVRQCQPRRDALAALAELDELPRRNPRPLRRQVRPPWRDAG